MKTNIAVLAGGYSGEYEISVKSSRMVIQNLDREKYNSYLICITPEKWVYIDENNKESAVDKNDFSISSGRKKIKFDCVFNIIHGTPGEDGKIQGYFDMLGIPYTSCNQYVSAMTFNKAYCNYVVQNLGVSVPKSVHLFRRDKYNVAKIIEEIKFPAFVKPCNGGSSFGTSKVKMPGEMKKAIELAFSIDEEILVEEFINGTEITCGLFRYKNRMIVLPITEIVPKNEFFDFEAKYKQGMSLEITPARISPEEASLCSATSAFLYNKLNCKGVVRMDYIMTKGRKMFFLEVNTIPGMSEMSIVPQQAKVFGYKLPVFLDMLIEDALMTYSK
ncbi:MAG TPA: D-alanine--D-alanine ligase [Bacteroidales bacterium]|nr:D-alanine--D-alanine ligase [Bacteroidales bacterium]